MPAKRKVCVVTGSRAEYGLLSGLMKAISNDSSLKLQTVVTGSHLSNKFGNTFKEILKDGFKIDVKADLKLIGDRPEDIASATGFAVSGLAKAFLKLRPDIIVLLGDRYEILGAAVAAALLKIPVAHLHGGEVTRGANDDMMRHAITKLSYLHFVCHKDYAKRVIQMGEERSRVFNVGALGIDNIKKTKLMGKKELETSLKVKLDNTALVTFHPTTMEPGKAKEQINALLSALSKTDMAFVITMPNADAENTSISSAISSFEIKHPDKAKAFTSLGQLRFLSLMEHSKMVIGNSSSGIIEAPSFKIPVINIGSRQDGRIKAANVIDCGNSKEEILKAVKKARSKDFIRSLRSLKNPFGDGNTASKIAGILRKVDLSDIKKDFKDL